MVFQNIVDAHVNTVNNDVNTMHTKKRHKQFEMSCRYIFDERNFCMSFRKMRNLGPFQCHEVFSTLSWKKTCFVLHGNLSVRKKEAYIESGVFFVDIAGELGNDQLENFRAEFLFSVGSIRRLLLLSFLFLSLNVCLESERVLGKLPVSE